MTSEEKEKVISTWGDLKKYLNSIPKDDGRLAQLIQVVPPFGDYTTPHNLLPGYKISDLFFSFVKIRKICVPISINPPKPSSPPQTYNQNQSLVLSVDSTHNSRLKLH